MNVILTWPDGRRYNGSWKDGKPDGMGTLYNKSGQIIHKGLFKDGFLVENITQSRAQESSDSQLNFNL
jgi:antitoxin component YwqK of YwqJK toxin-antitoxin module